MRGVATFLATLLFAACHAPAPGSSYAPPPAAAASMRARRGVRGRAAGGRRRRWARRSGQRLRARQERHRDPAPRGHRELGRTGGHRDLRRRQLCRVRDAGDSADNALSASPASWRCRSTTRRRIPIRAWSSTASSSLSFNRLRRSSSPRSWIAVNGRRWRISCKRAAALGKEARAAGPLSPELEKLQSVSFAEWVGTFGLPARVSEWIRLTIECELATDWKSFSGLIGLLEFRFFLGPGERNYHVRGGTRASSQRWSAPFRARRRCWPR